MINNYQIHIFAQLVLVIFWVFFLWYFSQLHLGMGFGKGKFRIRLPRFLLLFFRFCIIFSLKNFAFCHGKFSGCQKFFPLENDMPYKKKNSWIFRDFWQIFGIFPENDTFLSRDIAGRPESHPCWKIYYWLFSNLKD